jgi:hypothetical protein
MVLKFGPKRFNGLLQECQTLQSAFAYLLTIA